jgi:sn-glycerol 3-phosphate transport system substrate-binding protein
MPRRKKPGKPYGTAAPFLRRWSSMRRFALLVAVLSLALTACGGGGGGPAKKETPSGPVKITFWHSEPASANDNLVKLVERFNASQNEVKVEPIFQGNSTELMLKLIATMPSGEVPAVTYQSEVFAQALIDSGEITPIQKYVDQEDYDLSDFAPASIAYYTVDSTLYSMPCGLAVPLMYYNKLPFREVGLDPEQPPRDLDEARAASEKLVQRDSAGNVTRFGLALQIEPWFFRYMLAGAGELYVNNDNGRDGFATEVAFDNDAGRRFLQWWHDMVQDGLALNVGWDPSGANGLLAVGARNAVMVLSTSAALRSVMDVLEKGIEGVDLGVAPVPGIPGKVPEGSPGVYGRSLWIMSARPQEEQDAAWKFIKWFSEPEQQAEWFAGSGYLPVRNSAYDLQAAKDIIAKYPQFRIPADLFAKTATTTAALGALLGPFQQVEDSITDAIESMLSGEASPDEALPAAIKASNAAIKEYNDRLGR